MGWIRGARVSVNDRRHCGAAHALHRPGGRSGSATAPAFFSDGFTCDLAALIAAFNVVMTFPRTASGGAL